MWAFDVKKGCQKADSLASLVVSWTRPPRGGLVHLLTIIINWELLIYRMTSHVRYSLSCLVSWHLVRLPGSPGSRNNYWAKLYQTNELRTEQQHITETVQFHPIRNASTTRAGERYSCGGTHQDNWRHLPRPWQVSQGRYQKIFS